MPWKPKSYEQRYPKPADALRPTRGPWTERLRRLPGPDPRSTAKWQRLKRALLAQFPWCSDPYKMHALCGVPEPATEVDHRVSVIDAPHLAFEPANLQTLCHGCHVHKTRQDAVRRRKALKR